MGYLPNIKFLYNDRGGKLWKKYDFDDEDFELEDLEALRDTIEDLIDRKNARDFEGGEEADDDLDSFVVSMQDFDKEEPKLEESVVEDPAVEK